MQLIDQSRKQLFEKLDFPALKPLPPTRYQFTECSNPKVHIDYHVLVDKHHYSVPYQFVGEKVTALRTSKMVEIYFKSKRIAVHRRLYNTKNPSTQKEHMPDHHKEYVDWSPSRFVNWAQKIGLCTGQIIEKNLTSRRYPEQSYKTCLGILRLAKRYDENRLEAACNRALFINAISYKSINSILENGLDKKPLPGMDLTEQTLMPHHENIRGPEDYN